MFAYCSADGTLTRVPVGYCSVDGTLAGVPAPVADEYCSPTVCDTLVLTVVVAAAVAAATATVAVAIAPAYCSADGTRLVVPVDGYCCSVDGTLVRLPDAYCSADGTRVTALTPVAEYCSTEIVLVRVPPPEPPPPGVIHPPEPCCCSADGILVRVPKLLAEQLVVIVDAPPKATERRFGL